MKLKAILIGYYGAGNLGDELLLESTIKLIESMNSHIQSISIFSQNPDITKKAYPSFQVFNKFNLLHIFKGLWNSDILIFGGGSIFQDASSLKSLIYYCAIAFFAKLLNKKIFLLGQGIGPLKSLIARFLCKFIYKSIADFVSVRDQESHKLALSWRASPKKTYQGLDLACFLPINNYKVTKEENCKQEKVLISLRQLPGHSEKQQFNELFSLGNHLVENHSDCEFILFAFQKTDLNPLQELQKIIMEKGGKSSTYEIYSLHEWKSMGEKLFNEANMIYSMRFHGVLLASKYEVPCIGLIYDPKIESICKERNIPAIPLNQDFADNLAKAHELMSNSFHGYSPIRVDENCFVLKEQIKAELNF